jgi:hypothetical protein
MESDAAVANYIGRTARSFRVSGGGTFVDIVGVTGSIPVTPTILFKAISNACAAFGWRFAYFPSGSLNLRIGADAWYKEQ